MKCDKYKQKLRMKNIGLHEAMKKIIKFRQ